MRIAVMGGDRRMDILAERLRARHAVYRGPSAGLLHGMDAVVAQNVPEDGLIHMRPGAQLFLMGDAAHIPRGVRCVQMMEIEDFVQKNAVLTAEGAVYAAMNATEGALTGSCCLVAGYGRIARALTGMLIGVGAHVIVAARRAEIRAEAAAAGASVCDMDGLGSAAAQADFIFSTPPALLFDGEALRRVRPGVPLIDLASAPYGVDLDAARALGVKAWRESGLPGRYCPAAAAALMEEAIEARLKRE